MRAFFHLSCAVLALGCSTDTFVGADSGGGGGDASGDVAVDSPIVLDGATEAGVTPVNPNNLGNDLVLWLRADEIQYDSGTGVVAQWPDKSPHNQAMSIKVAANAPLCSPVGLSVHPNEVNSLPAVSFCQSLVEAADDASLQFGTSNPFVIASVMQLGSPAVAADYVFAAKSTSSAGATGFALLAPNSQNDQVAGYLNVADPHVTAAINSAGEYHIVTMVRRKGTTGTTLTFRIDNQLATQLSVPTQDVSEIGAPFAIGGFDAQGVPVHVMPGKVAEVLVVTNPSSLPDALPAGLDLYLKQKYGL